MPEKRRILLVENQSFQFNEIVSFNCLKSYDVFPLKEDFITFIDNVRVWVNSEYFSDYRNNAIKYIVDFINDNNIELIIMDYILGGAFHCLTGIDLAEEINKEKTITNALPIIFLSKTDISERNRVAKYDTYLKKYPENECTIWIHKGYFGDEILKEEYFEKEVIKKVESLFPKRIVNKVIEKINSRKPNKIDSASTSTHRDISIISDEFINKLQKNEILIDIHTLDRISTPSSDSEYLNVLKELNK